MGSKGSTQQVTNQTAQYTPSPQIQAAGTQALQGGQAAAQQPFWLPQQPVAGFTPDQLAAFQNVRNMQGMTAPWFGQAGQLAQQSATPLTADQIANFYNPMAQNVTNQLQNIYGQQMRETTGKLTQAAGGVGADRIAVGQANLANQQGLASGQIYAQLYQQALQAAMQNQQMQGQAAFAMGNLGQGAQGAALQANQAMLGTGGLQQQLAQAQLMSPYAWLGQQFAYPYQANQYLAGITGSLVPAFPSTTTGQSQQTTTPPQPSPLAQGIGLGMAGLGAYQNFGYNPFAPLSAGTTGGTGGGLGGLYAYGGRVGRQMGGQAGITSMPQLPPQASQMAQQVVGGTLPGNTGPRPGFDADDMARRSPFAGANPQAALQQAMQSPQIQQLLQRYPWLQQMMQHPQQMAMPQMPQMPQQAMGRMQNPTFGTGTKGAFSWPGRSFADGGAVKPPAIPAMGAGTASDMDAYFSKINDQAQNLAAMSRFAMQPTGTGGWRSPFFGSESPTISTAKHAQSGQIPAIFSGSAPQVMQSPFHPSALSPQETTQPVDLSGQFASQGGFQQGGSVGKDPFGETDSFVPDVTLTPSTFHGPDLPKLAAQSGSSSGKGSTASDIGTAATVASTAMKFLPMLLAAHGGAVGPFSHYQHFQEGGGDDMTDINTFPFTPPDASPIAPSPEDLRPPVPTPFAGWGDAASRGLAGLRPTRGEFATPQEAEQARLSKELFAKRVAATPEGAAAPETPIAQSPFLPKSTRNMTYETAGAATPTPAPSSSPFGGLPAMAEVPIPEEPGRAPVTPVQRANLPGSPFDLPVQQPPTGQGGLFQDEKQRQAMSAGMPQEGVPMPPPRPELTQAPMPPPRPDIAGPPGQAFARTPPIPVSRQSIAQDAIYAAKQAGIDPNVFLRLINRESGFNPHSRGAAGEIGLGQLMPGTAREMGVQNPWDPVQNLQGAAKYFKQQLDRFGGDYNAAAMAYNAGPNAVASGRIPASSRAYAADVAGGGPFDTTQLSANAIKGGPPEGPTGTTPSTPEQYTLPSGQTPFPQAGMQYPGMSLAQNPLFRMGANIAASRSPWPGVAIGEGISTWAKGAQEEAGKQVTANQAAQRLWLDMQKHVDTMTKLTPAQEAAGWQMTFDPVHGTPMLFNPRSMKSYTYQNGQWTASDVGAALTAAPGTAPGQAGTAMAEAPPEGTPAESPAAPVGANPGGLVMPTDETVQKYGAGPAFNPKTGQVRPDVKAENDKVNTAAATSADAIRETERSINEIESNSDVANKALATSGTSGLGKVLLGAGTGADARFKIAQFLATYGPDELNKQLGIDRNAVGAITEINKEQAYLAANRTRMLGAREAYQVLELMMRSNPGWEQTPEGRARVLNAYKTAIEREKDYQKFLMAYRQKYGNNVAGAQQAFDALNPSQKYVDRANKLAEYEGRSNQQPAAVRAKIYDMPKNKQIEMYDNLPILLANRNNPKVVQSFDRNYNGLSGAFLSGGQ